MGKACRRITPRQCGGSGWQPVRETLPAQNNIGVLYQHEWGASPHYAEAMCYRRCNSDPGRRLKSDPASRLVLSQSERAEWLVGRRHWRSGCCIDVARGEIARETG